MSSSQPVWQPAYLSRPPKPHSLSAWTASPTGTLWRVDPDVARRALQVRQRAAVLAHPNRALHAQLSRIPPEVLERSKFDIAYQKPYTLVTPGAFTDRDVTPRLPRPAR